MEMHSANKLQEDESTMQVMEEDVPELGRYEAFQQRCRRAAHTIRGIERQVNHSTFGRMFRLKGCGHEHEIQDASFLSEIRAGLTTFATMAYIIAVNSSILADSGGTCICDIDSANRCRNDDYDACVQILRLDLITATCAVAGMACILFGTLTNLPVCLAPGMGLNAYFTYQVVGVKGTGSVPYQLALAAVFTEGWIFMALALTGMRHWLVKIIPATIKTASGVGIGLFVTLIGMSYSAGIGLVTGAVTTPTSIAGCPPEDLDSQSGQCTGHIMTNPKMWLGIVAGGMFTTFLMAFRMKSAIVLGIILVSVMSWPRNTPFTYFPYTDEGNARFDYFKQVAAFHPIEKTLNVLDFKMGGDKGYHFALALFTFLYVDLIDCTATLYSMARFCNRSRNKQGDFPRATVAYCTDALMISLGSLVGCSPVTAFVESGAGIAEGGRTGLTAITCGCCFLISLFFAPVFASIPPWATGCTLIIVGCLMIRQVVSINWKYAGDAIPSFVTLAMIPFTYSVAYGLIAGLLTYTTLNLMIWLVIKISRGSIVPKDYDSKEYWTWRPAGEKPLIFQLFSRHGYWRDKRTGSQGPPLVSSDSTSSFRTSMPGESTINDGPGSASGGEEKEPAGPLRRAPSPRPFRSTQL